MTSLREADQALVSRYVGGALTGQELADFERRLLKEPALRSSVEEQREVQDWFARVRASEPAADAAGRSPSFVDGVIRETRRRVPSDQEGVAGESGDGEQRVVRTARMLLVAAALILGLSLLVATGVLRPGDGDRLAADPARVEQIDRQMESERRDVERQRR